MYYLVMFLTNLLISLTAIIGGWYMLKHHPKKINYFSGYRSIRSRKSKEAWIFANEDCGKRWLKLGLIMFIITAIIQIPFLRKDEEVYNTLSLVICIIETIILLVSIIPTEFKLKENFTDEGVRK